MCAAGEVDAVDDPQTVQALLDNGAGSNRSDGHGNTALMYAAQQGLNGAARVLIAAGANTGKRNKEGKTALQLAKDIDRKQLAAFISRR